jgi:hypothetical protein
VQHKPVGCGVSGSAEDTVDQPSMPGYRLIPGVLIGTIARADAAIAYTLGNNRQSHDQY